MTDPTRFRVASRAVPIWEREERFQDLMAVQLTRTPWLLLSLLIHGLAVLLFLLSATPPTIQHGLQVAVQPDVDEPFPEPPPPRMEPTVVEETLIEPTLVNVDQPPDSVDSPQTPTVKELRPLETEPDMSVLGLGPGPSDRSRGRLRRRDGIIGHGRTIKVIERGLSWLASHQDEDGKWDTDEFMRHDEEGQPCDGPGSAVHDVGITALALLAFLGDGNTLHHGPHRDSVKRSVLWLRGQQAPGGLFGTDAYRDFIYDHAIAAYAMCEAYGLSGLTLLRPTAQGGIDYLEAHRNPYGVWRYHPREGDNDTSVTGWAVMAYKSAQDFELRVNETALENAAAWFDRVTDGQGQVGYTMRGEPSARHPGQHARRFPPERGEALTAVGLLCRFFLGQDPREQTVMNRAADRILAQPPSWDESAGTIDHYYWYYASYALYQIGGRHWRQWSLKLTDAVVKTQRRDGNRNGSWDPLGVWGEDGGRVYSTAMMVLTLQAYYRYTRLLR